MRISGKTLDDLLYRVYGKILKNGSLLQSTRGKNKYLNAVLLELREPRARLSRTESRGKVFSALGELLWYLSKTDDLNMIKYYLPKYIKESTDQATVYGAYGPRLFYYDGKIDQIKNVTDLLRAKPNTRRAVIQLFHPNDIERGGEQVACTCYLQFALRRNRLHMIVNMRSNDAYVGLPHDVFCFTMIQEIIARSLNVGLGVYRHFAGDLHIYEADRDKVGVYLTEEMQSTILMPEMPDGDPWPNVLRVLDAERAIRTGAPLSEDINSLPEYWRDIVRLLEAMAASGDEGAIENIKSEMAFKRYAPYLEARKTASRPAIQTPKQMLLPL